MQFALKDYQGGQAISARIRHERQRLVLAYDMSSIGDIAWPAWVGMRRADRLWEHTCLELFIADPGGAGYLELNFSPSGEWNAWQFGAYRDGMCETGDITATVISPAPGERQLHVEVGWRPAGQDFLLGPAAVIEQRDGKLRYYAVSHGDKPDFHDRSRYTPISLEQLYSG